ncbi:MAG: glutamate racemase, partial [Flavobacteriaceae bacterium]|nr:glutamate racemase [Flavobacteriaceae bacterium]
PIGLFDSGIGGLSIWQAIHAMLPRESTLYLADSKHAPYGEKSMDEVINLAVKNTEYLLDNNCKLIVVACNTATTQTISHLRKSYEVPFIGIEPAIKPAALDTQTNKVGVLATKGTLASSLFHSTTSMHAAGVTIFEQEGTGLVERVEAGELEGPALERHLMGLVQPMVDEGIDQLVLGCTHYPFLIPSLKKILPDTVHIVDCSPAIARQTAAILLQNGLENTADVQPRHEFYTNGDVKLLSQFIPQNRPNFKIAYLDF